MSWSIGYDQQWKRDIGYGVPCYCDHPLCDREIDRGLAFVCGGQPYGGNMGCGLYFCALHLSGPNQRCQRCNSFQPPFDPKPDHPDWIKHKLTDESWREWRDLNPDQVDKLTEQHKNC